MNTMPTRDWSVHPPLLHPDYKSTLLRGPRSPLLPGYEHFKGINLPVYGEGELGALDHDLTQNGRVNGEPIGERIVVHGKVTDQKGKPLSGVLIEVWQANAAGRYIHKVDQHDAPIDPNFLGGGRCITDKNGQYTFYTIKPGAYPWGNHHNAWRPNHIHFSLIGPQIGSRLVTQMYFPGDPLLNYDPIYLGVPEAGRKLLVADFSLDITEPAFALGYEFNIVLNGSYSTPFES